MFVEINGETYVVKFQHDSKGELAKDRSGKTITVNRFSKCIITKIAESDQETPIGVGTALCHSLDNFDKEKGRQKALGRALEASNLNKDTRTIFWGSYRNWKVKRF